ncbi:MAG: DUF1801 domain-containing protein [Acidimicrobiia bacterium]|nr:DUF1801 domain-containing protein [Acidimicrobiia bacterium]MDH3464047.1 DUF1801 domain-containing protein [Acidimicrobiia bacterium]
MAENKTQKTKEDAIDFLNSVENKQRREDALEVAAMMERITGEKPRMWGSSIVGFGDVHLEYDSGREVDYFKVGLSPRKASLTLYLTPGFIGRDELLAKLGRHTTGKGCLYFKSLDDVEIPVLEELVRVSVDAYQD